MIPATPIGMSADRCSANQLSSAFVHGSRILLLISILSDVSEGTFLSGSKKTLPPRNVPDDTFQNLNEIEGA